ncbi:phage holin, LLH family [Sporolactobacillus pectinivorans]|uniref:phage holin, LLH family n=1 Tax=Sporolactobacillus pectinivorans TaxID=1591408 RepID=UPI000C2644FE|nr:phage holin, LLH family [Sporolactobacillus pectinivorans]
MTTIGSFFYKQFRSSGKYKQISDYVGIAVRYAEQYLSTASGQEKYKKVVDMVAQEARRLGLKSLTGDKLSAFIEAEVQKMKTEQALFATVPAQDVPINTGADESVSEVETGAVQKAVEPTMADVRKITDLSVDEFKQLLAK